jgi:outer membrane autotransporter protein
MQSTYTLLGGADMSPSGDGDGVRLGVYGGYTTSSGHFAGYSASAGFKGAVAGAYAAYTAAGAYVDAQFDAQFVKASLDDTSAALNASSNGTTLGVIVNAGKRFDVGFGYFEPIASFTYANTTLSDMVSGPATLSFDNTQSIRAAVGARVGAVIASAGGGSTEISVLAKLWNEFAGNTAVTVSDSVDSDTFRDSSAGLSGEVAASITTYNAAKTLSGFVSAGAELSSDSTTVNAKLGVRKSF